MPVYEWVCPECKKLMTCFRTVDKRNDELMCDDCNVVANRLMVPTSFQGVVVDSDIRGEFRVDFGDGKGTQRLSRYKYVEECKRQGRQPVGLTFVKPGEINYNSEVVREIGRSQRDFHKEDV